MWESITKSLSSARVKFFVGIIALSGNCFRGFLGFLMQTSFVGGLIPEQSHYDLHFSRTFFLTSLVHNHAAYQPWAVAVPAQRWESLRQRFQFGKTCRRQPRARNHIRFILFRSPPLTISPWRAAPLHLKHWLSDLYGRSASGLVWKPLRTAQCLTPWQPLDLDFAQAQIALRLSIFAVEGGFWVFPM